MVKNGGVGIWHNLDDKESLEKDGWKKSTPSKSKAELDKAAEKAKKEAEKKDDK